MRIGAKAAAGTAAGAGGRMTYRSGYSRVLFGIFVAFASWWVVDAAVGPRPLSAVSTGLWLLACCCLLAALFWRPAVIVDHDGVELHNVMRDVQVPWARLESIDTRYALTLHSQGRRHQSWAGAAAGRPVLSGRMPSGWPGGGRTMAGLPGVSTRRDHSLPRQGWTRDGSAAPAASRDLGADSGAAAFMIEQHWDAWQMSAAVRTGAPSDARTEEAGQVPGNGQPGDRGVTVRWRPVLPGLAIAAAVLATGVGPLLR